MQFKFAIKKRGESRHALANCEFAGVHPSQQLPNVVLVGATEKTIMTPEMAKWVRRNVSPVKNSDPLALVLGGKERAYPSAVVKLVLIDAANRETSEFETTAFFSNSALATLGDPFEWIGSIGTEDMEKYGDISRGRSYLYWQW